MPCARRACKTIRRDGLFNGSCKSHMAHKAAGASPGKRKRDGVKIVDFHVRPDPFAFFFLTLSVSACDAILNRRTNPVVDNDSRWHGNSTPSILAGAGLIARINTAPRVSRRRLATHRATVSRQEPLVLVGGADPVVNKLLPAAAPSASAIPQIPQHARPSHRRGGGVPAKAAKGPVRDGTRVPPPGPASHRAVPGTVPLVANGLAAPAWHPSFPPAMPLEKQRVLGWQVGWIGTAKTLGRPNHHHGSPPSSSAPLPHQHQHQQSTAEGGGRGPADKSGGRAGNPSRKGSRLRAPCRRSRCQDSGLRNDDGHQHTPVQASTPRLNNAPGGGPGIGSRAKTRLNLMDRHGRRANNQAGSSRARDARL